MDTLTKPIPAFGLWQGPVSRVTLSHTCPKCGSLLKCIYGDMSTGDYLDAYAHVCSNEECDYSIEEEIYSPGMSSRDDEGPEKCPFCGRRV